jgi:signal transduction histidine kinase
MPPSRDHAIRAFFCFNPAFCMASASRFFDRIASLREKRTRGVAIGFRWILLGLVWLLSTSHSSQAGLFDNWQESLARWLVPNRTAIQASIDAIRVQIHDLPPYELQEDLRGGFHTRYQNSAMDSQWVQVDLGQELEFDRIVLVPVYVRQNQEFVIGYGFPKRFRVEVSDDPKFENSQVIEDFSQSEFASPKFPVQISRPGMRGRYLRIAISQLSEESGHFFAALGELMVLSNNRNIALWRPVHASSSIEADSRWSMEYLVDEYSLLPAPLGEEKSPSDGIRRTGELELPNTLTIDLGDEYRLDELRLYPSQPSNLPSVPGWGMPASFRIDVSSQPDFRASECVLDFSDLDLRHWTDRPLIIPIHAREFFTRKITSLADRTGSLMLPLEKVDARFVRVTIQRTDSRLTPMLWSFAEIQVYSGGKNVALDRNVSIHDADGLDITNDLSTSLREEGEDGRWKASAVVDGYTSRRRLVELPLWLEMIEQRKRLESALGERLQALDQAQELFRARVSLLGLSLLLVGCVGVVSGYFYLRRKMFAERSRLRDQLSSDLHDDIGSNLATITLLSRSILSLEQVPHQLRQDLAEISQISVDTSDAMRDMLWISKPRPLTLNEFIGQLRLIANRMLGTCELAIQTPANVPAIDTDMMWRRNAFLSCKEIFHNLHKHSQAKRIVIDVQIHRPSLIVQIEHDGVSFEPGKSTSGHGLTNIRKRIDQLRGEIKYENGDMRTIRICIPLTRSRERSLLRAWYTPWRKRP